MTERTNPADGYDAVQGAHDALLGPAETDAALLAALREGLLRSSDPSARATAWHRLPHQRAGARPGELHQRRP